MSSKYLLRLLPCTVRNTASTMERRRSSQTSETGHHGVSASGELPEDRRGSSHDRPLARTLSGTRSRSSSGGSTSSGSSGSSAGSRKSRKSGTSPGQHRDGEEGQWLACVSTPSDGASSTASTAGIYSVLVSITRRARGFSKISYYGTHNRERLFAVFVGMKEQDHRMDVAVSPRNILRRSMRNPTGRLSERCQEADIKSGHEGEDAEGRGPHLCQDYDYLASEYRRMAQYRDLAGSQLCAMCLKNSCEDVLFPCQHKCICPDCMKTNDIGDVFTKVRAVLYSLSSIHVSTASR